MLGIALTLLAVVGLATVFLVLLARTACDGARMMSIMPSLSERDQHQSSDQNTPLARPLPEAGSVVGLGGVQSIHTQENDA